MGEFKNNISNQIKNVGLNLEGNINLSINLFRSDLRVQ